jgi:hypothetical protein
MYDHSLSCLGTDTSIKKYYRPRPQLIVQWWGHANVFNVWGIEDIKGVIWKRISQESKYNDQQKMDKNTKEHVQNTTQKLNIEQHEPLEKQMVNSAPSDG